MERTSSFVFNSAAPEFVPSQRYASEKVEGAEVTEKVEVESTIVADEVIAESDKQIEGPTAVEEPAVAVEEPVVADEPTPVEDTTVVESDSQVVETSDFAVKEVAPVVDEKSSKEIPVDETKVEVEEAVVEETSVAPPAEVIAPKEDIKLQPTHSWAARAKAAPANIPRVKTVSSPVLPSRPVTVTSSADRRNGDFNKRNDRNDKPRHGDRNMGLNRSDRTNDRPSTRRHDSDRVMDRKPAHPEVEVEYIPLNLTVDIHYSISEMLAFLCPRDECVLPEDHELPKWVVEGSDDIYRGDSGRSFSGSFNRNNRSRNAEGGEPSGFGGKFQIPSSISRKGESGVPKPDEKLEVDSWSKKQAELKEQVKETGETRGPAFMRKMRALLNKLTNTNYMDIFPKITEIGFMNVEELSEFVGLVFEKAIATHKYLDVYCELCAQLQSVMTKIGNTDDDSFKKLLVVQCQQTFNNYLMTPFEEDPEGDEEDNFESFMLWKTKMKGTFLFIANLIKTMLVPTKLIGIVFRSCLDQKSPLAFEALTVFIMPAREAIDVMKKIKVNVYKKNAKTFDADLVTLEGLINDQEAVTTIGLDQRIIILLESAITECREKFEN